MKMIKKIVLYMSVFVAAAGICLVACNNGDDPVQDTQRTNVYEANVYPSDPNILNITTVNGDKLYVIGEKDENGLPIRVNEMRLQKEGAEEMMVLHLDEQQRITDFTDENGVKMFLEWLSDDHAALTLVEPESGEQLNTVVYFGENAKDNNGDIAIKENKQNITRSGSTTLTVTPVDIGKETAESLLMKSSTVPGPTGQLYITNCGGLPTDAQCCILLYRVWENGPNTYLTTLSCKRVEKGVYQYTMPSYDVKLIKLSQLCKPIANIMETVMTPICESNDGIAPMDKQEICLAISTALASGIVSAPAAAIFETVCSSLSYFIDIYCSVSSVAGGDFSQMLCASLIEQDKNGTEFLLKPLVNGLSKDVVGMPAFYSPGGNAPTLTLDLGGEPTIGDFSLNPPAPAAYQSYAAIASLSCMEIGTKITMSIVGTDGYQDTQTQTVTSSTISYTATLHVPGSYSGVKDVCKIVVNTPYGGTITKTASLVFQ